MSTIKVLLFGHPNVGKSSLFNRLTGLSVEVSNYPGTTVEIYKGYLKINEYKIQIIDAPGAFSTIPSTTAEDVARRIILEECPDIIIHVIDATSIRRHLYLTMELLDFGIPLILVLNQIDRAKELNIVINKDILEKQLGVPVIFTVATTGEGVEELIQEIIKILKNCKACKIMPIRLSRDIEKKINEIEQLITPHLGNYKEFSRAIAIWVILGDKKYRHLLRFIPEKIKAEFNHLAKRIILERLNYIDTLVKKCITSYPAKVKLKKIDYIMMKPVFGTIFIAILTFSIIWGTLAIIHEIGHKLPLLIYEHYEPFIRSTVEQLVNNEFIKNILIGDTPGIYKSLGLLTTGIFFVLVMILPMLFVLYLILGILEDLGFIPRVAVAGHNCMRYLGLSGDAFIPLFTGTGCSIVGVFSSRVLKTEKERFLSSLLQVFGIPCMAQQVMIWMILGKYGLLYVLILYIILLISISIVGAILGKLLPGEIGYLLIELPAWRKPKLDSVFKKTLARVRSFLFKGAPLVFLGVLIVNIAYYSGAIIIISTLFKPIIGGLFKLPEEAAVAIIIGMLRKDVAVGLLGKYNLTPFQTLTAITVLTLYFPCIGSFLIILSEFGPKKTTSMICIMFTYSLIIGSILGIISTIL